MSFPDSYSTVLLYISSFYVFIIIHSISIWMVFVKANQPGWAALIPVYKSIVWLRIINKPATWVLFLFIPLVNIHFAIKMTHLMAKKFGRDSGFTYGLILLSPIFYPLLAFKNYTFEEEASQDSVKERRNKEFTPGLLIWGLSLVLISIITKSVFEIFQETIFESDYLWLILLNMDYASLCFGLFLIGLSVKEKYLTWGITVSMSLIILNSLF